MNFWEALFSPVTQEDYDNFQRDYDPTPEQWAEQEAEDTAAYIDAMPAEREVWYTGTTGHWRTYVTDQKGHKHYRASGEFYAGHSGEPPAEIIDGEVVTEKLLPVYMRLQG